MLFDITVYNQGLMLAVFVFASVGLLILFKRKYYSLLDPLVLHLFWLAGNFSFLLSYLEKYGFNLYASFFLLILIFYCCLIWMFLGNRRSMDYVNDVGNLLSEKKFKIKLLYLIFVLLVFIGNSNFFLYALSNPNPAAWFLYRFVDLQGRNAILRILGTGSMVYFYFFSFIMIHFLNEWKKIVIGLVIIITLVGVFQGGRSSVLQTLFFYGAFIFYFRNKLTKRYIRKINIVGSVSLVLSIFLAAVISSFYTEGASVSDGVSIIANRFIAVGDGLEYYINYNGQQHIKSGFWPYFLSVFGIYVAPFLDQPYKNVGTQLTELVVGEVSFAQGSNYTLPLQIMVFGKYLGAIYVFLIAFCVGKLRSLKVKSFQFLPLAYFFAYHAFTFVTDIEYATFCSISGLLMFFVIIYPILKISIK